MQASIKDEPWFRQTENLMCDYWRRTEQISRLEQRLARAEETLRGIQGDIADARTVRSLSQALSFTPGSLGTFGSGLDVELVRMEGHVERLLKVYAKKQREVLELKARIANRREENAAMQAVMARLTLEEYRYTEQRWVYRRSNYAIAQALYCHEARVRRMRVRLVCQVADWLGIRAAQNRRKNDAQNEASA